MLSAHGQPWGGLWGEQRNADFLGVCFCFPKQPNDSDFSSHSCNSANDNTSSVEVIKASVFVPLAEPTRAQMNLCTQQPPRSLNQRPCAGPREPPLALTTASRSRTASLSSGKLLGKYVSV